RGLIKSTNPDKLVSFTLQGLVSPDRLERMGEILSSEGGRTVLRVKQADLREVVSYALSDLSVDDLSVEDPPLEDVLRQLFASSGTRPGAQPDEAGTRPGAQPDEAGEQPDAAGKASGS